MQGQVQTNRKEVMHNEEKDWPLVPPRRTSTLTETRFEQFRENAKTKKQKMSEGAGDCVREDLYV